MNRPVFFPVQVRSHSFREGLNPRILAAQPVLEPEVLAKRKRAQRHEDIRLFLLSFSAFFVSISSFIW